MATTSDLRKGMLILHNGAICKVVEYQHIAPGNWRAMVRMKLKNFQNGKVVEDRVRAGDPIEIITTETKEAQYLYDDGEAYHFMDIENYDQFSLPHATVEDVMMWLRENENVTVLTNADTGAILSVEAPNFVILTVTSSEMAIRGDTSGNVTKKVTLETGATVQVPAFVKEGDQLKVDTRTGEYVERA